MKRLTLLVLISISIILAFGLQTINESKVNDYPVDSLLQLMKVEEKVGLLNQDLQNLSINPAKNEKYVLDDVIRKGHLSSAPFCDRASEITRPLNELKGFKSVMLKPCESKKVEILISAAYFTNRIGSNEFKAEAENSACLLEIV